MKRRIRPLLEEPQMNLTPLIDVVFVVLILFIVIAPLLNVEKIDLAEAGSRSQKETNLSSSLAIYVLEDNSIQLHQKKVDLKELCALLQQEKKQFPHQHPQLFQDKRAQFGTYQAVKNAVEAAGFSELDVILYPN